MFSVYGVAFSTMPRVSKGRRRTKHSSLLDDDRAQISEDFVKFMNAGLYSANFGLSFLYYRFLERKVGRGKLLSKSYIISIGSLSIKIEHVLLDLLLFLQELCLR